MSARRHCDAQVAGAGAAAWPGGRRGRKRGLHVQDPVSVEADAPGQPLPVQVTAQHGLRVRLQHRLAIHRIRAAPRPAAACCRGKRGRETGAAPVSKMRWRSGRGSSMQAGMRALRTPRSTCLSRSASSLGLACRSLSSSSRSLRVQSVIPVQS